MALGHALEPTATRGAEALRAACRQHQVQVTPELLDRGDWREALDRAYRAQFALEDDAVFLGDHGWSLTAAQVRTIAAALERRLPQIFASLREELRLADLVSDDEAAAPALLVEAAERSRPGAALAPETPPARARPTRPAPSALGLLEERASADLARLLDGLREALTPVSSEAELVTLLRPLRALLAEAEQRELGLYLGFA